MDSLVETPTDTQRERVDQRVATLVGGRWYLEAVLGVGGMAAVYRAVHHRNGRRVAVKILHTELCTVQELRERFYQEAYAANRVAHPGAVPALDDGELPDGTPFLVLEYLEGETLEERWKRADRRLPVVEAVAVMEQLLDILVAAHNKGIVHRDIKPENIFLTSDGRVRLLDFGIAHVRSRLSPTQTRAGAVMGTPAFMPPEQARGRWDEVDGQSDLFAVAASLYTLISGRFLHDAETSNEYLLAAMTRKPIPLRKVAPEVPEAIAAIVDRGVAFEKSRRFASALEMKGALRRARENMLPADWDRVVPTRGWTGSSPRHLPGHTHQALTRSHLPSAPGLSTIPKFKLGMAAAVVLSACLGFLFVREDSWPLRASLVAFTQANVADGLVLSSSSSAERGKRAGGPKGTRTLLLAQRPVLDEGAFGVRDRAVLDSASSDGGDTSTDETLYEARVFSSSSLDEKATAEAPRAVVSKPPPTPPAPPAGFGGQDSELQAESVPRTHFDPLARRR